jgi:thiol-disulfide isomerase/thioredoxin
MSCDSKTQQEEQSSLTITQSKKTSKVSITDIQDKNKSTTIEEKTAPIFTITTVNDKKLNISEIENGLIFEELKDKAIFLVFFGYRCPPCRREVPVFIELIKEHKDLAIVAIEVQGYDNQELKDFGQRNDINYHLISSDANMEFISYIQAKSNWHGSIPFLLGLNKNGEVKIVHTGGVGKSALEGAYQDLINIK